VRAPIPETRRSFAATLNGDERHFSSDFESRQHFVAQQRLNCTNIGSALQKMRCKRMSQHMRTHPIFIPFATTNRNRIHIKINIQHPQAQAFRYSSGGSDPAKAMQHI